MERSQRQSDNVYRWIKYFADQPKKPEAIKPRATPSPAPTVARKPEPKAAAEADGLAAAAPETVPTPSAIAAVQEPQPVNAPTAVASVTAPVSAEAEVISDSATPLVPVSVVEPTIPKELRNASINTKVLVSFTVQPNGTVTAPTVLSSNNRRLNRSAVEAIAQWRFEPIRSERVTEIEFQFVQD